VRSLTILVVEDVDEFRRFVCSLLKSKAEFRIEVAADGLEAVQKAQELQPDLILLDIGLPKLHGLEVARRVRTLIPATRILFVSALSDPDVVGEALNLGSGYVHKPSVQSDLLPAIEAVLKGERFVSRDLGLGTKTDALGAGDGSPK
jgi:CheY-like chemotaxis protein